MTLFFTMLPVYLFGNLHCLGMCGPLVAMIGRHRFRWWYFAGRTTSFALAGLVAGLLGAVLHAILSRYHIPAVTSLLFGSVILVASVCTLGRWSLPMVPWLSRAWAPSGQAIAALMLKDKRWPTLLFGLATILLPCGQTVIVYSACALEGDPIIGLLNGAAFALLTSPSLILAMHTTQWLGGLRHHYNTFLGVAGLFVGAIAVFRGMAELDFIPHLILNPASDPAFHIALY